MVIVNIFFQKIHHGTHTHVKFMMWQQGSSYCRKDSLFGMGLDFTDSGQ